MFKKFFVLLLSIWMLSACVGVSFDVVELDDQGQKTRQWKGTIIATTVDYFGSGSFVEPRTKDVVYKF